jgi:multidrug efflux pump subunit AcrA (membrane-fusion protein)
VLAHEAAIGAVALAAPSIFELLIPERGRELEQTYSLGLQWHAAKAEVDTARRQISGLEEQLKKARDELAKLQREALKVVTLR